MIFNAIFYTFFNWLDDKGVEKFYKNSIASIFFGLLGFILLPIVMIMRIFDKEIIEVNMLLRMLPLMIWGPFFFYYNYLLLKCFLPLTSILIIAATIIGFCVLLAIIGTRLERRSNNPLKGFKEILLAENNK